MGNALPDFLEVVSPALETRIKIDMPGSGSKDVAGAYAVFSLQNVLQLCQERLMSMAEYQGLLGARLAAGAQLALAWRSGTNLDWVWQLDDVREHPRKWAVLAGLALSQVSIFLSIAMYSPTHKRQQGGKPAHLEIRLKEHMPTRLHLRDGTRLDEPPAVEGYVERIRPNSQLHQALYLTTHNGYLFTLLPAHAYHPPPPGFAPLDSEARAADEVRRGAAQILRATGMLDMRSIVAVRRAFQLVPGHTGEVPRRDGGGAPLEWDETEEFWHAVERVDEDDEDVGGEAGLARCSLQERPRLKMRRSFELLLATGSVVRFEVSRSAFQGGRALRISLVRRTRVKPLSSGSSVCVP